MRSRAPRGVARASEVATFITALSDEGKKKPAPKVVKKWLADKPETSKYYIWYGLEDFCARELMSDWYKKNLAPKFDPPVRAESPK